MTAQGPCDGWGGRPGLPVPNEQSISKVVSVDVKQHLKRMFLWKCVRRFKTLMAGKLQQRCRQGFMFLLLLFIPNAANNSACDEFFDLHIVYINTMSGRSKDSTVLPVMSWQFLPVGAPKKLFFNIFFYRWKQSGSRTRETLVLPVKTLVSSSVER